MRTFLIAGLLAAGLTAEQSQVTVVQGTPRTGRKADSKTPALRAYIDPETGTFGTAPEPIAAQQRSASRVASAPAVVVRKDGSSSAILRQEDLMYVMATVAPDGTTAITEGKPAANKVKKAGK